MLPSFEELFVEDGPELQIIPQMVGEVEATNAVALHLLCVNDHLNINRTIRLRIQDFLTKNVKKLQLKIFFFYQKLQFTYPWASKFQKKPSALKREHPALQNMKFLQFFVLLWVIFALLDPDPDSEYGSGSTDLTESGSNLDPDPNAGYLYRVAT